MTQMKQRQVLVQEMHRDRASSKDLSVNRDKFRLMLEMKLTLTNMFCSKSKNKLANKVIPLQYFS